MCSKTNTLGIIKKILLIFLLIILNFSFVGISYWEEERKPTRELWNPTIKDGLLETTSDDIIEGTSDDWLEAVSQISIWVKDSLTSVIVVIAVWTFLFIWIRLAFARGNPEEFKKAMMQLIYAVVWVFIVSIAWAVVSLVAWIHL